MSRMSVVWLAALLCSTGCRKSAPEDPPGDTAAVSQPADSGDPKALRTTLRALRDGYDPDELGRFVGLIAHDDLAVRDEAADALWVAVDNATFARETRPDSPEARWLEALGARHLEALLAASEDPEPIVRRSLALILGCLDDPRAAGRLS